MIRRGGKNELGALRRPDAWCSKPKGGGGGTGGKETAFEERRRQQTGHPGRLVGRICLRNLQLLRLPCVCFFGGGVACPIPLGGAVPADTAVLPPAVCWILLNRFFPFIPFVPFFVSFFPFVFTFLVPLGIIGSYGGDYVGMDAAVVGKVIAR